MSDEVECRYHGRTFTSAEMALMRSLIEDGHRRPGKEACRM